MSNHRSKNSILLHHSQVDAGRERKAQRLAHRLYTFQINRAGIKFKLEADAEYLTLCAFVFFVGLIVFGFGLFYLIGAMLYG